MKGKSPGNEEMESLTVRISRSTHAALRALAEETDESMTEVLDKAIEIYRRQRFLAGLNADFAALRKNKAAWEEELAERSMWDAALTDGLED
jgi:predicted transcriptional regulator